MSKQLFEKAVVFGDLHLGKKDNSKIFNDDCDKFIDWMISESKTWGAETCIFLGDWHHHRKSINVSTLEYSLSNLEKLNENFKNVYFILGNHDIYYKDKRDIHSLKFGHKFDNIKLINEIYKDGNCVFVPWLVGEEYKNVPNKSCKYMFGHFELPYFLMNAMVEMPDNGELKPEQFNKQEYVFTGHFHKRQNKKNIWYIGSPFPHDFNDAEDNDRGILLLEWNEKPIFKNWPEQPSYKYFSLSEIINDPDSYLNEKQYVSINSDIDISFDETQELKKHLQENFNCREVIVSSSKLSINEEISSENVEFQSIDQIVVEGLKNIKDSETSKIDYKKLIDMYNEL